MRESQPDRYLGVSPVGISAALRLSPARRCACGVRNRSSGRLRVAVAAIARAWGRPAGARPLD
jgi:hypothetical protein